ncbi:MAG: indole-3-glycerol-phosphate synthase [Myxococcota bacterium]
MSRPDVRRPPGVLGTILTQTLQDLETAPKPGVRPVGLLMRDFAGALSAPGLGLIAEVKPRSPSAGVLRDPLDIDALAAAYAPEAAAVSVLVDERFFGGGYGLLQAMRARLPCPILAKGFFVDERQVQAAAAAGADAVLLMAALLPPDRLAALDAFAASLGLQTLMEAHDDAELQEVLDVGGRVVGVNSRDLQTLSIDLEGARQRLARVPTDRIRVAESGLHTPAAIDAVRPIADAVLMGTALMKAPSPAHTIAALGLGRAR